jgi:hypothetical protein
MVNTKNNHPKKKKSNKIKKNITNKKRKRVKLDEKVYESEVSSNFPETD